MKKTDKKAVAVARFIENVAEAGGALEAAKAVDDHAYRRGMKDGKRLQRSKDLPVILAASALGALIGQAPHLLLFLYRRGEEKKAREREEAARIEDIRAELERKLKK